MRQFTENLTGARVGEEKRFRVEYRPDYPEKRLAGKAVDYTVKIEGIKTKEVPELNDEFAQRFGENKTLDDLKAKFRQDLEAFIKHTLAQKYNGKSAPRLVLFSPIAQ